MQRGTSTRFRELPRKLIRERVPEGSDRWIPVRRSRAYKPRLKETPRVYYAAGSLHPRTARRGPASVVAFAFAAATSPTILSRITAFCSRALPADPQQADDPFVDSVDQRQVLVAFGVLEFIRTEGADSVPALRCSLPRGRPRPRTYLVPGSVERLGAVAFQDSVLARRPEAASRCLVNWRLPSPQETSSATSIIEVYLGGVVAACCRLGAGPRFGGQADP